MCTAENLIYYRGETIFDITCEAVCMSQSGEITVEDSRQLYDAIFQAAKRFDEEHTSDDPDYMDTIGSYAREELLKAFGPNDKEDAP